MQRPRVGGQRGLGMASTLEPRPGRRRYGVAGPAEGILPGPQIVGPAAALLSGRNGSVHAALCRRSPPNALQMSGPRPTQGRSQVRRALNRQKGGLPLSFCLAGRTWACPACLVHSLTFR